MSDVTVFENMIGRTMVSVTGGVGDDVMHFIASDGASFRFWYDYDCCAHCSVNDIAGDMADLVGSPIVQAEVVTDSVRDGEQRNDKPSEYSECWTWSFYKFATVKGSVTVRWLGESNGYYSETVTVDENIPGQTPRQLSSWGEWIDNV